jgi:hypothetical protein
LERKERGILQTYQVGAQQILDKLCFVTYHPLVSAKIANWTASRETLMSIAPNL